MSFKLSPLFLSQYEGKQPQWGFGDLSYFVYKRTYARIMPDGRQEEYFDTCRRVTEGVFSVQKQHCLTNKLPWKAYKAQKTAQEFFRRMWEFKFTPPGRGFWIMGTPMVEKIGSAALQNCGYTSSKDVSVDFGNSFAWAMDMLMLGVGVGFDTKGAGTITIKQPGEKIETFDITDDREGWVKSVHLLINSYVSGPSWQFTYDKIRPMGEPIKGFGGTASGPGPLRELHDNIRKTLDGLVGQQLTSVAIVDLFNFIGKCVVAGNVRRSAELAIGDIDDEAYVTMKDYNKYGKELSDRRWASNNSVFANPLSDFSRISPNIALNGEPGLIFLDNARHFGRVKDGWISFEDERYDDAAGFNPCKPLHSLILTPDGYITFKQALEKDKLIVATPNGDWVEASAPFKTGENREVIRVRLSNGLDLFGTINHKHRLVGGEWKEIGQLSIGDRLELSNHNIHDMTSIDNTRYQRGLLAGWTHGDGSLIQRSDGPGLSLQLCFGHHELDVIKRFESMLDKEHFNHSQRPETCKLIFSRKKADYNQLIDEGWLMDKNDLTWLYGKDKDFKLGFLRAVFTADGSVRKSRFDVELYSTRRNALVVISNLLREFGVPNSITKHANAKSYIASDGKVRNNADCWKINCKVGDFATIGFISEAKDNLLCRTRQKKLERMRDIVKVVEIERNWSQEDVYDITVYNDEHAFVDTGITTHNCAEQCLEDKELCCLVETYPANHDSAEDYLVTLKYAYLYAKSVTLIPTHDERTNSVMMRNRRIGCSMSGIQQAIKKFGLNSFLSKFCDEGYDVIRRWDRIYSRWLGIPRSIRMTTVKPSGTVSILAGATPGVHFTHSEYYWRLVRVAADSPLILPAFLAGYRIEVSVTDNAKVGIDSDSIVSITDTADVERAKQAGATLVIYFPVKEKNFTKSKFDATLWEQLAIVREMQYYWSDNAVSCTVTVQSHEASSLGDAISFYAPYVKTLSFLPLTNHKYKQAPYIECSKEEYDEYIARLGSLHLDSVVEMQIKGSKFCTTDKCEI